MDEKKTYKIIGTVTIGTDEYRDLVETCASLSEKLDSKRTECWKKDSEIEKLNTNNTIMKKTIDNYTEFFNSCTEASALYKAFVAEKTLKEANMI